MGCYDLVLVVCLVCCFSSLTCLSVVVVYLFCGYLLFVLFIVIRLGSVVVVWLLL